MLFRSNSDKDLLPIKIAPYNEKQKPPIPQSCSPGVTTVQVKIAHKGVTDQLYPGDRSAIREAFANALRHLSLGNGFEIIEDDLSIIEDKTLKVQDRRDLMEDLKKIQDQLVEKLADIGEQMESIMENMSLVESMEA